jgi:aromatic-L-amino-acid decarboxylase
MDVEGTETAAAGDMSGAELRRFGTRLIDWVAGYLDDPERWPVLAQVEPGALVRALPAAPPQEPEPFDRVLDDFERLIPPATTHWNHPGFFAYFGITGSGPGVLGELLAAALNVNAMVWRTGPAATELEQVTLAWLRQMLGLDAAFTGTINDTASTSTMYALAAAREADAGLRIREEGLAGRPDVPRLRIYCSEEAHSSVDKAAIALGIGLNGVTHVPTDEQFAMRTDALRRAIEGDIAAGVRPLAVVATVGTTSVTAIDPVPAIAELCAQHGIWLHVDAAYGGAAAILPEMRGVLAGCERADSIVVNPHKWMFVPVDCSVLYTRRDDVMRRAFSLTPAYLTTAEDASVRNLMDYGVALGRRFRALKLWFVLRYFGANGMAERLREHIRLARLFAAEVDADPGMERLAPTRFSVVVFRLRPPGLEPGPELDAYNEAALNALNASGEVFLSHTRVRGLYAMRLAIGNLRTRERHVRRVLELLRQE